MQIIVKSTKLLKKGTNEYGDWKLIKITTISDEEYTTLAKDADTITTGATVNISDMDETEKGKSFKKFEIAAGGTPPQKETSRPERDNTTNASIEVQVAVKAVIELRVADRITEDSQLAQTADNWIMSKLQYWSSQGAEEVSNEPTEKMITDDQIERIKKEGQKYSGQTEVYVKILKDAYGMTNYKKLNTLQAEDLIKRLANGEGL